MLAHGLATKCGHLPSASTSIKSLATAVANLRHILKRDQCEDQEQGLLCSGKNWQNTSWDRYFQKKILWAQFLHLLISRKALKSFMAMTAPHHEQKPSAKCMCLIACIPLRQNHIFTDLSPYFFGAVSQSYLKCYLPRHSSHFAPNKT